MVVACTMVTDKRALETVVLEAEKGARFGGMCLWGINCRELCTIGRCIWAEIAWDNLFTGDTLGPGRGWSVSTGAV